jgi:hypothetical protein
MNNNFAEYNIPLDGYAAFDALSLKSLIIKRLSTNNVFTDQNFEGSNLSSIIDIIGYAYHVLLFYLNKTGAESTFSTADLYENINKIVKLLNYAPVGYQTAILPFKASGTTVLPAGTYTIPRYSYFTINGLTFSFNKDITFTKATNTLEELTKFEEENLLYQGLYHEYPTYFATGEPYEVLTPTIVDINGNSPYIDHFNIDVYVKDNTLANPKWEKWKATQSLFLERANAKTYEIRLNENLRYEIKFGNDITGKQLNPNDEIAIYYLQSDGARGEVGPNTINGNRMFLYNTVRFNGIQSDTTPPNLTLISSNQTSGLIFTNTDPTTRFVEVESVNSIKANATNTFKSQYRLITSSDFENYITKNYGNIIASTRAVNNWEYISGHLKYYFDLGVSKPNLESRVLYSQLKFADASNSNNVYIYSVPKLEKINSIAARNNYLNSAQKQILLNDLQQIKLTTSEIIINDPVYTAVDIGVRVAGVELTPSLSDITTLEVIRNPSSARSSEAVQELVYRIFSNYFSTTRNNLGLYISLTDITNEILSIEGVVSVNTTTTINGIVHSIPGVSLMLYNPVYPYNDINITSQDLQLPYFKYPFLNNTTEFINKISVVSPAIQLINREY